MWSKSIPHGEEGRRTGNALNAGQLHCLAGLITLSIRPDGVEAACERGDDVVRSIEFQVFNLILILVAALLGLVSIRVNLFRRKFQYVAETSGNEGTVCRPFECDVNGTRFISLERGCRNCEFLFERGSASLLVVTGGGGYRDVCENGVRESVLF